MPRRQPQSGTAKKRVSTEHEAVSRDKRNGTVTVSLRIPAPMLKEIDKAVKDRPYKMPRHMWLLEAVHEKLTRVRQLEQELP